MYMYSTYICLFAFFAKAACVGLVTQEPFCENVARTNAKVHSEMPSFANSTEFETFPMCNGKAKETLEFTHRMRLTKKRCVFGAK